MEKTCLYMSFKKGVKTIASGSFVDKSTALTSSDITVNDLIKFINTGLKKECVQFFVLKKRKKGSPAQNNVPNATDESLSSSSNVTPTNKDVKAFDINIKEEDLKVIKEKLTQSLNKQAVFFINSFSWK